MTESSSNVLIDRVGWLTVFRRADITLDDLLQAREEPGTVLKQSRKAVVRQVGPWVFKESRLDFGRAIVRGTLDREAIRRGWHTALYLEEAGIHVPRPIAYIEAGWAGVLWSYALVTEYLDGFENVERYGKRGHESGWNRETAKDYLIRLADWITVFNAAGVYHADLSGKNILTADGEDFYFVDLDSAHRVERIDRDMRMRNHIQLYDSFCDWWDDALLTQFITRMLPSECDDASWMEQVRAGQQARRARVEAIWANRKG